MAKYSKKRQHTEASQDDAMRIARGTQRPGQAKEQTKLIAQGIQKGIEEYKKRQKAKARELDKKLKKVNQQLESPVPREIQVEKKVIYRQHWLPWVLLVVSWLVAAAYFLTR